jgi:hypothetical protein
MKDKLELQDIAGYLPWGLRIRVFSSNQPPYSTFFTPAYINDLSGVMPFLHPISDLTKEIDCPDVMGEKFVPINRLKKEHSEYPLLIDGNVFFTDRCNLNMLEIHEINKIFQKLYQWHFDINGLIEKGLAIDINTL